MLRTVCVRAARARPARVATASRWRTTARPADRVPSLDADALLFQPFFERLLHVGILPLDDRLSAELPEVLLELDLPLVGEHALADLLPRLLEWHRLHRRRGFELEN